MRGSSRIFRKPESLHSRRHFLLIGAPRSGTTLLASMLGRHNDVAVINEDTTGKGLRKIVGKTVTGNKLCVPNQIRLKRNIFAFRLLKKVGLVAESPRSRFSIEDYLELSNLSIVAIVRDGNDTISSMMERGKSSFKRASKRWAEAIETIYELRTRLPARVLVLTFEDLVLNPEETLGAACSFLGLTFQKQMLEGQRYNPKYPQGKLDEEKVHRYKKGGGDFRLALGRPSTYRKFEELLVLARQSPIAPVDG
ncbi:MAG: sulfotransferase family protein [Candidatus Binatia bacterium]